MTQPEYWDHPRFGRSRRGYPVVGVSWYEASAYCGWLTEQLQVSGYGLQVWRDGGLETLDLELRTLTARLPSEGEWTAAGGGEAGSRYPWGEAWDESRANTREGGIGGTSPVGMYPSGRSPRDVWDMGGNVWEWTASRVEGVEREAYALRGGSWYDGQGYARVSARGRYGAVLSHHDVGFRVVVSPAVSGF